MSFGSMCVCAPWGRGGEKGGVAEGDLMEGRWWCVLGGRGRGGGQGKGGKIKVPMSPIEASARSIECYRCYYDVRVYVCW